MKDKKRNNKDEENIYQPNPSIRDVEVKEEVKKKSKSNTN
jgi:aspartate carbamoyltransferase catalytic subunit